MATGPFPPISPPAYQLNGLCYPGVFVGHTNSRRIGVHALVAPSIASDCRLSLVFAIPDPLPSGTCKLRLILLANATSGAAKINPAWASMAIGDTFDTITLNAEGTQTVTWTSGDDDENLELEVDLDADTPVAGEYIYMRITFETSSWTLAAILGVIAMIVWE